jgi:putative membrane protein
MSIAYYFSEEDLTAIEDEVKLAEKDISGEIVPVFMERSHDYPESIWRAVALGMLLSGMLVIFIDMLMGWAEFFLLRSHIIYLTSMIGGGLIMAALNVYFPSLRRRLTAGAQLEEQVHARAERTFLEYEIFRTRQRTGILIFISLFERRVEIIGDKGISEKVSADEWEQIVAKMVPYLHQRENKDAIVTGIRLCRELLLKYGFAAGPGDTNELPDHLRQNLDK